MNTSTAPLGNVSLPSLSGRDFVKAVTDAHIVLDGVADAVLMQTKNLGKLTVPLFLTKPVHLGMSFSETPHKILQYAKAISYAPCPARAVLAIAEMVKNQHPFTTDATDLILVLSEPVVWSSQQYVFVVRKIASNTSITLRRFLHDFLSETQYIVVAGKN